MVARLHRFFQDPCFAMLQAVAKMRITLHCILMFSKWPFWSHFRQIIFEIQKDLVTLVSLVLVHENFVFCLIRSHSWEIFLIFLKVIPCCKLTCSIIFFFFFFISATELKFHFSFKCSILWVKVEQFFIKLRQCPHYSVIQTTLYLIYLLLKCLWTHVNIDIVFQNWRWTEQLQCQQCPRFLLCKKFWGITVICA